MGVRKFTSRETQEKITGILALFEEGCTYTIHHICEHMNMPEPTAASYMRYMRTELLLIRKAERPDGCDLPNAAILWELGVEPGMEARVLAMDSPSRKVGPAAQVGMVRDWAVAAVFGPGVTA